MCKVKKGGVRDLSTAARHVLTEWATGKIRYYSMPPSGGKSSEEATAAIEKEIEGEAKILNTFSEEFDINALFKQQDEELAKIQGASKVKAFCMSGDTFGEVDMAESDNEMDGEGSGEEDAMSMDGEDELGNASAQLMVEAPTLTKSKRKELKAKKYVPKKSLVGNAHNRQKNKETRLKQKKLAKKCGINVPVPDMNDDDEL